MRPGQNKRMRGRNTNGGNNNNRKGPNPLTRSYESNGPDVKIRGTAHHIGEKYLQLARDAQSSGDPVMAESYLQHAEHYFRLIAAAQLAQQQSAYGYQRPAGEPVEQDDDDGDDDFGNLPDRFASPSERVPTVPAPQPVAQPYNGGQPYEARGERYDRGGGQQPGIDRQQGDRPNYDRPNFDRQDRSAERNWDNRNGRDRNGYQDRNQQRDRNGYQDRGAQQDRPQQQPDRAPQPDVSSQQDRGSPQERQDRGQSAGAPDRPHEQRQQRDYDNRGFRNNRGPRDAPREQRQPQLEEPASALPAFITAPVRVPADAPSEPEASLVETAPASEAGDDAGFHLRPRRRRRPKADLVESGSEQHEAPASDPVGE